MTGGQDAPATVVFVQPIKDCLLYLEFADGSGGVVDLRQVVRGPVFASLLGSEEFRLVQVDEELGTVVWPSGVDLDADVLWDAVHGGRFRSREVVSRDLVQRVADQPARFGNPFNEEVIKRPHRELRSDQDFGAVRLTRIASVAGYDSFGSDLPIFLHSGPDALEQLEVAHPDWLSRLFEDQEVESSSLAHIQSATPR